MEIYEYSFASSLIRRLLKNNTYEKIYIDTFFNKYQLEKIIWRFKLKHNFFIYLDISCSFIKWDKEVYLWSITIYNKEEKHNLLLNEHLYKDLLNIIKDN